MIIKLRSELLGYLNHNWGNGQNDFENHCRVDFYDKTKSAIIDLDDDMVDLICDWANEQLVVKGFDGNYELNSEGKILDEIVDLLTV